MNFTKLFTLVDGIIGDISTFKGLTFALDSGVFVIDLYRTGEEGDTGMFICDFTPHNAIEPISFAAKGIEELKEQISHYIMS